MLDKTFDPQSIEPAMYDLWQEAGAFQALKADRKGKESFTIVIPPPNVTGSLHIGHALDNTLQDILIRMMRMRGRDVLWQPGTDHAGIATQLVVERTLAQQGEPTRRELGREAFLERVWAFKEASGGTIINQLKRLGASCDWSRERFTLDEGLSKAVTKVFVSLYDKGLIYKDKRLVNWDPKLLTAVSDLEVEHLEVKGHLWHFFYPSADNPDDGLVVATTRPETMFGDVAVAVHPDDERYQHLIGKHLRLPLVGRLIPVVADSHANPELGSGAVKITPAHDFNDYEVGKRHNLPQIAILDKEAKLSLDSEAFICGLASSSELDDTLAMNGMDRFEARKLVISRMEALGYLRDTEEHVHTVPYDEKSKSVVIEPMLTDQWYVAASGLAGPAIEAVRTGKTEIIPSSWEKTYYNWMENIQPWCISRQLWWGHRIPAWYGPDGAIFVATSDEEAHEKALAHYGAKTALVQDEDVLDTWFSSALWPFSTLGWPENDEALQRYFPTSVLVTGFDILFFWVARMMMMGLQFMDEVPFRQVYLHALVRDEKGQKMSKTRGNVIDPLDVIDLYGADALRFTLAIMTVQGRDLRMSVKRVEGYRNFATKLWNAFRFAEMNGVLGASVSSPKPQLTLNKWLLGEIERAQEEVDKSIHLYRFNDAANALYRMVWNSLCDWFVEISKVIFMGDDEQAKAETRATMAFALEQILRLLHPFMPFLTEKLWQEMAEARGEKVGVLALAEWPALRDCQDSKADEEISWLSNLVTQIRSVRAEMNVPAAARLPLSLVYLSDQEAGWLKTHEATIKTMARVEPLSLSHSIPEDVIKIPLGEAVAALSVAGSIDMKSEFQRLDKERKKLALEAEKTEAKLNNSAFVSKAPDHVIEEQRSRLSDCQARLQRLEEVLARMSGI